MALCFTKCSSAIGTAPNLVIFASDPDDAALAVARVGVYPKAISADVSEARLERYFMLEGDHYHVVNNIRDNIVFAVHNLLRDPPFSRQNLISCRNLLIYLDRETQEQAMSVFRYACRERAYLFLGASETADESRFRPIDKKFRIYATREPADGSRPLPPELLQPSRVSAESAPHPFASARARTGEIHLTALEELAPPSLVVDERWNVLHLSPTVARFLQQGGGPLAQRITDLVRPELRDEMHALLHRIAEGAETQLSPFVSVRFNGTPHRVVIVAQQRAAKPGIEREVLITFIDGGEAGEEPTAEQEPSNELVRSLLEAVKACRTAHRDDAR